jgi:ORF6N domain
MSAGAAAPVQGIERKILLVRGHKVLLDADLAAVYGVETRTLNQAVKRNPERFPPDFMCRLSTKEFQNWRSQSLMSTRNLLPSASSSSGWRDPRPSVSHCSGISAIRRQRADPGEVLRVLQDA